MKCKTKIFVILTFVAIAFTGNLKGQDDITPLASKSVEIPNSEKLVIMWTSGDRDVAIKMVFMYTFNAQKRKWWDDITLIVWGPSAKLITEDKELQGYLKEIMDSGTKVIACKGCSDQYGVSEDLENLGIRVAYIGKEFTDYIKEGRKILTF